MKLDASVVQGVAGDAARAAFVRGLVIMLRSLALKVYAEGVTDAMDVRAFGDCDLGRHHRPLGECAGRAFIGTDDALMVLARAAALLRRSSHDDVNSAASLHQAHTMSPQ